MAESGKAPAVPVGNSCHRLARHDYGRAIYRAMLSRFTPQEIKENIGFVPLQIDGKEIRVSEPFHLLGRRKTCEPLSWEYGTDNPLESFMIGKGRDPAGFRSGIVLNSGTRVQAAEAPPKS